MGEYMGSIIDLFREFSSASPEEKESAERRRSNYIPTILFLLMSIRMPDGKKAPGEEREIRTRGISAHIYADVYAEMRLRRFHALIFLLSISFSLSLDTNLKKTEIVYSSCFFFFYKEVYLLIVIF